MVPTVIRAVGLPKDYGAVHAPRDLDLEVAEGEVFGYLGPNGVGKTTDWRLGRQIRPLGEPGPPAQVAEERVLRQMSLGTFASAVIVGRGPHWSA